MTIARHNDLADHATSSSPEDRSTVLVPTVLVHSAWAGWYYEGPAAVDSVAA